MIRVGFVLTFADQGWLGGISYFRNLISALLDLPDRRIDPVGLTSSDASAQILASFGKFEVIRTDMVKPASVRWRLRRGLQLFAGRDVLLERFLRRHGIALLSHSGYLGRHCPLPALPWIPDFQEMHLPEFFSERERAARTSNVMRCCTHGSGILVSSESALNDLTTLAGPCASRARVLRFAAAVPPPDCLPALDVLQATYRFNETFFHLPNQFWAHKNHVVVLRALALLKAQGRSALVLATGNPGDHRQPGHYQEVMREAEALGVVDRFRVLGVVPYLHLMGIMNESAAVINPSLFEGWSTTVEEAKSMGKQLVLSDIPVHREQSPEGALYFDPDDASQLAERLRALLSDVQPRQDAIRMEEARSRLPARRRAFAERYQDIALEFAQSHG
jgi:glycosyltransferase involved in cell wall biosynthesis